jgi:sugar transferase (PEP-CTERM/EpsH1 system associated)
MKIVVVLSRVPYPLIKGDKLRAFNQIKALSKKHDIYLFALNDSRLHPEALQHLEPFCKAIKIVRLPKLTILLNLLLTFLFKKLPLQTAYFYNRRAAQQLNRWIETTGAEHIYCQLIRTTEYVKHIQHIPKTLDYMDSLSSGMQRRIEKAPPYLRWVFRMETRRLKKYEHEIFNSFDHKTIISERDQQLIVNYRNAEIEIVENGVDHELFYPNNLPKKYDLLFTGNMSYPPNVECALFLIKSILPLVWKTRPQTQLVIAGANPSRKLKELASEHIHFTDWVEDIREYYWQARIFVAPMQIGSGLQNKLLEAMAMKLPCVTSTLANKSLMAPENEAIRIGSSPEEYAEIIIDLLQNPEKANRLAEQGYDFVKANFNWETSVTKLNTLFNTKRNSA